MHPQTLRQYDRLGLVQPGRAAGGGRRYSVRDVVLLREVQRLSQDDGVNLAGIKRIIGLERLLEQMQQRVAELESALDAAYRPGGGAGGAERVPAPGPGADDAYLDRAGGLAAVPRPRPRLTGCGGRPPTGRCPARALLSRAPRRAAGRLFGRGRGPARLASKESAEGAKRTGEGPMASPRSPASSRQRPRARHRRDARPAGPASTSRCWCTAARTRPVRSNGAPRRSDCGCTPRWSASPAEPAGARWRTGPAGAR